MAREWIKVGVALLVLVGVTLYVSFHKKDKYQEAEKQDLEAQLVQLDLASIGRVDLINAQGEIQFLRREKKDDAYLDRWAVFSDEFLHVSDWWIKQPHETMADRNSFESMLSHLEQLKSKKLIDEKGENPEEYDLKEPLVEIRLYTQATGKPVQTIQMGAQNSAGSGMYIRTSLAPKIVLAGMELDYLKNRGLYDWRMKELFGYKNKFDVESLVVDPGPGMKGIAFEAKQENRHWSLVKPVASPADDGLLDKFGSVLQGMRAKEFVSEVANQDASKYGFDQPLLTLKLGLKGKKETKVRTFWFSESKLSPDLLVRRSDLPQIFAVEKSAKGELVASLADLVSKRPYKIDLAQVSQFQVSTSKGVTALKNIDGEWKLTQPVKDLANASEVDKLVKKLIGLKGGEYVGMSQPKKGSPYFQVELITEGGKQVAELREGTVKQDLWLYAQEPDRTYRIARGAVAAVFDMLDKVRERRWLSLPLGDLASVQIQQGERVVQLAPGDEGSWGTQKMKNVEKELKEKLGQALEVKGLLNSLKALKLETFGTYDNSAKRTSRWSVEFRPKNGETAAWQVGAKDEKGVPVWSDTRKVAGWVKPVDAEQLEKFLAIEKVDKK